MRVDKKITREEFFEAISKGLKILEQIKEDDTKQERINKALHRIQLLQMDGEVTVRDLGLIVRDLRGDESES